jgi:hypothetical protein
MAHRRTSLPLLLLLSLALTARAAVASPPAIRLAKTFPNPNPEDGDLFGYSVALAGPNILVGAPFSNMGATNAGAAYLFDGATGTLLQTFQKSTPAAGDWFGIGVGAVGSNALIGALGDDTGAHDAGAAFLFDATTGALLHTFQKPQVHADDWFGGAVGAVGTHVLVGAPVDHVGEVDSGGAYLFDAAAGNLLQSFHKPQPASGEWFGVSIAAAGDNVLVGAYLDRSVAKDAGAAYLFDGKTGALLRTFQKPAPAAEDQFGVSVAAIGNTVVIGAPGDSTSQPNAGAVYLFDAGTGQLLRTLQNPTPVTGEQFGHAVAASGTDILVGAPTDGKTPGAAYLFDGTTGMLLQRFQNPTPAAGDSFGFSLAAAADRLLIAAPGDHTGTNNGGAAYLFKP